MSDLRNPMSFPWRDDPERPLDPDEHPQEAGDEIFLEMDQTKEEFRRFQQTFEQHRDLTRRGWLAIVQGDRRSGKTTLINQSAHWAKGKFANGGQHPVVVNLRAEAWEGMDPDERFRNVGQRLVTVLRRQNFLHEHADDFVAASSDPGRVYADLADNVKDTTLVIVLLPTMQTFNELSRYVRYARPRLLLFAEIVDDLDEASVHTLENDASRSDLRKPTFFRVGRLQEEHVANFLNKRINYAGLEGLVSSLPPKIIGQLATAWPITVGGLQSILYDLYQEFLREGDPRREITWDYVTKFIHKRSTGLEW